MEIEDESVPTWNGGPTCGNNCEIISNLFDSDDLSIIKLEKLEKFLRVEEGIKKEISEHEKYLKSLQSEVENVIIYIWKLKNSLIKDSLKNGKESK